MEPGSSVSNGVVSQAGSPRKGREQAGAPRRFAGRVKQLEAETVALRQKLADAEAEEERVTVEVEALRGERRVLVDRCEKISGFIMGWSSNFRTLSASTTRRGATGVRAGMLHALEPPDMVVSDLHSEEARFKEAHHAYDQVRKQLDEALLSKKQAEEYLENVRFDVSMLRDECERTATALTLRTGTCHALPGASGRGCGASRFRWVVRVDDETVVQFRASEEEATRISTVRVHYGHGVDGGSIADATDVASVGCSSACTDKPPVPQKQLASAEMEPGDFELPCELVGAAVGTCVVTIHRFPIPVEAGGLSTEGASSDAAEGGFDATWSRRALAETTLVGVPLPECPDRELPYEAFLVTVVDGPLQIPASVGSDRTLTPRPSGNESQPAAIEHQRSTDCWWPDVPQGMDMGLEMIRAQFRRLDETGVGTITQQELAHLLQALDASEWTDKRVERLLRATKARDNGRVRYEVFLGWLFDGTSETASNVTPRSVAVGCGEEGAACGAAVVDAHPVVSSALLGSAPPGNPIVHEGERVLPPV